MKLRLLAAALWIVLLCASLTASAAIPQSEHDALMALYNATNGPQWLLHTNWGGALGTENIWYGVTTDAANTHVLGLELEYIDLSGPLPPELADLSDLQVLQLDFNQLTGTIPLEICSLSNLRTLSLCNNQLSGVVPPELSALSNLQILALGSNHLTGTIPPVLAGLSGLTCLDLSDNKLTGTIPPELGSLANLQELDLFINQLTGLIPPQIGNLTNLHALSLFANHLAGPIPGNLGSLTDLLVLDLGVNQLSGSVPPQIGNLTKLQFLYLWYNTLSGPLPHEMGQLASLREAYLDSNYITGSIPPEIGVLANLQWLGLSNNRLTGSLPPQLGGLVGLMNLDLDNNQLSGPIPSEICSLPNLLTLRLSNNNLSGQIPPAVGNLSSLDGLFLDHNRLTGGLPTEIGTLSHLQVLWLSGNALVGDLPASLQDLGLLQSGWLDIRWNGLYSNDPSLIAFLNGKQHGGDWQSTQTVAPANLLPGTPTATSIPLQWDLILYTNDAGGYQVFYSQASGGPYSLFGTTATKTTTSMTVTGLMPNTSYFFVIRSKTNPNSNNKNTVVSDPSSEASASTPAQTYDLSLYDDRGAAQLCVNTQTGAYLWHVLSGSGSGSVYSGTARITYDTPTVMRITSRGRVVPGPYTSLNAVYWNSIHRANGVFQVQGMNQSIYSTLNDSNTLDDPPCN